MSWAASIGGGFAADLFGQLFQGIGFEDDAGLNGGVHYFQGVGQGNVDRDIAEVSKILIEPAAGFKDEAVGDQGVDHILRPQRIVARAGNPGV